jgi:phosphorylcholine metabolism protein LicD
MDLKTITKFFGSHNGYGEFKDVAIKLLRETIAILDEFNIDYFLISGTLLGYVRHSDIIPWDDDIDLIIDKKILGMLPEIIKKYDNIIFSERCGWILKTCFKNGGIEIPPGIISPQFTEKYNFPFIDLFLYGYTDDKSEMIFYRKKWKTIEFFPPKKVNFLGMTVLIPKNPHYFLEINYGSNYMTTLNSSVWNHKTESGIMERSSIPIEEYLKYSSI